MIRKDITKVFKAHTHESNIKNKKSDNKKMQKKI